MDIQQLQQEWQDYQLQKAPISVTQDQLMDKLETIEKRIKQRSRNGLFAFSLSMFGLGLLIYMLVILQVDYSITVSLSLWWGIFLVNAAYLWRMTHKQLSPNQGVSNYLQHKLEIVQSEVQFYLNLWKHFSLPLFITGLIMSPVLFHLSQVWTFVIYCSLAVFSLLGHHYCKNLVTNKFTPLANKIQSSLSQSE